MKFEYCRPYSLLEAASIMKSDPQALICSGGTDVMVRLKQRLLQPSILVDLKAIPELHGVAAIGKCGLRIGASVTLTELFVNKLIKDRCLVLSQAAALMACVQVRNRGTIGGNLANASPSADTAPPLLVVDAQVEISDGALNWIIALHDFFTGPGQTVLNRGEILVAIHIPDVPRKAYYIKHTLRKAMDIAGVSVALSRRLDDAPDSRLVLGAVAPTPIRVPAAEALLNLGKVREAAETAAKTAKPIDDVRSSADYRRWVIPTLVERAYAEVFGK